MTGHIGRAVIIIAALAFCSVILSFFLPLAKAFFYALHCSSSSFTYGVARLARIAGYTFAEAGASTLLAIAIGIPAAFLIARRSFPGRRLLASFAAIPLCVPPLIVALGYISSFGMSGHLNRIIALITGGKKLNILYSFGGLIMAQGFYNFPIVMSSTADCWAELNTDQADSARLLGAGEVRCFMDITLFQLLPAIISGAITVFIYCFFSFMFVLLFGVTAGTTLEVAIYHAGKSRLDFRTAAILSIIESISAMTALFALAKAEDAAKRQKGLSLHSDKNDSIALAKKEIAPAAALILIIAIFFVLPLLSIVFSSFTTRTGGQKAFSFKAWSQLFQMKSFHISLRNTLFTATATGITCSMAALVPALILRLSKFIGKSLIRTLALFPMAVSSVIMGLGMTILIRRGSPVMLILAQSALYWPFAFRQIQTCLSKIPDSVIEAATILSPCKTDGLLKVILPYCRRSIISGTLLCFAMSCSDATLPLVLSIYKFDTLSLFTYRLAGSYRFTQASAAGSVLGLVCILAFSLSNMAKEKHGIL